MSRELPDEVFPCETCPKLQTCDPFSTRYCCDLCKYHGKRDCEKCKKHSNLKDILNTEFEL